MNFSKFTNNTKQHIQKFARFDIAPLYLHEMSESQERRIKTNSRLVWQIDIRGRILLKNKTKNDQVEARNYKIVDFQIYDQ